MFLDHVQALKTARQGNLSYFYVSLSNICNARCIYCDVHSAPAEKHPWTQERLRDIFGQAKALGCKTMHFLGGGEPLVAPSIRHALRICQELNLRVVLTTNGSHLEKRLDQELADVHLEAVLVSLDSHLPESHDATRQFRGLWQRAITGMKRLKAQKPQTHLIVNHVVTCANTDQIRDFAAFAADLGVDAINLIPVKDCGSLNPTPQQKATLLATLDQMQSSSFGPRLLFNRVDALIWQGHAGEMGTEKIYRCVFPEHALYLDCPTGDVFPCDCTVHREPTSTFVLGNVFSQSLQDIWTGHAIEKLRATLRSPCDPGCKRDCDWNNMRTNDFLLKKTKEESRAYASHV